MTACVWLIWWVQMASTLVATMAAFAKRALCWVRKKSLACRVIKSLDLALTAQTAGADYVAFGSFFASATKPDAPRAEIALLQHASRALHLPIVAIGGITPDNAESLIEAGADALAVIHALFEADDIEARARCFADFFIAETED